ncbi:hypothetical protein L332_05420 [Agrococcus pavilionensis RW1]|uniref:Stage II sporulation protein M n=1 Tax=Agrococcus pavilionensis RW1 TaxID=1330458 RepID=U1LA46_9MICO|nr:stage II sporulation protein M [Agrococcus pavilionensis]ERG63908.1 hypothetical protein L332_05420 [Agrococcus pavilionensis RW1]
MSRSTVGAASERGALRLALASSAVLAAGLLGAASAATAAASGDIAAANAAAVAGGSIDSAVLAADGSALGIAASNLAAIALLASGAPVLGSLTLVGISLIGIGIGVSAASVVAALGAVETLARIAPYIVFEVAAVLLAATAGLLPVAHVASAWLCTGRRPTAAYAIGLGYGLRLTAVAALLVVLAAVTESLCVARGT